MLLKCSLEDVTDKSSLTFWGTLFRSVVGDTERICKDPSVGSFRRYHLERLVVTGKIEGKRPRGRSPKRWSDQIVEELQIPVSDALHQATERDQWRRLVDGIKRSHDPQ
ncbi:hypothetical protein ACJJTC_015631 [Scirpophaga incertulas]